MNSPRVARMVARHFSTVPPRGAIPAPMRRFKSKRIEWDLGDVVITTFPYTLGRILACARPKDGGEAFVVAFGSNHKAAVRALIQHCLEICSKEGGSNGDE